MPLSTLVFILFLAQIGYPGGQYPGGQYPPGQYPGGGGGIPFPGRTKKTTSEKSEKKQAPGTDTRGIVQELDDKSMDLRLEDSRILTFAITDQTLKPKDLAVGYTVDVSGKQDDKGNFTAETIKVVTKGSAETAPATGSPGGAPADTSSEPAATTLKGPKYDPGDDGPPKLKRGKPPASASHGDDTEVAENAKPAGSNGADTATMSDSPTLSLAHPAPPRAVVTENPRAALIDRARDEAANFLEGLPNYICNENTTRYVSEGHVNDWHALDVVSLELVYEGGKEDYRNIQLNGKALKGKVEDTGAWSTGEFGTILLDLFSPATAANFRYVKDSTLSGFTTSLYDFTVDRDHSHWHVKVAAQSIYPSYKGSIWVDKKTARVIRIEMQATKIPVEFPQDAIETAVDYGYVSLGATEKFFLPTHAEILSCERGANVCGRNVIDFRNYHKFTGDSKIIFDK